MDRITPDEFANRMRKIADIGDTEGGHLDADDLMVQVLRSLGYDAGCDVYDSMRKWYA